VVDRGQGLGTVVRWDRAQGRGIVEVVELAEPCAVDAAALHPAASGSLRAGQVVAVEWERRGADLHAVLVTPREDLQTTLGA
jgi:cold shock CspA family protein